MVSDLRSLGFVLRNVPLIPELFCFLQGWGILFSFVSSGGTPRDVLRSVGTFSELFLLHDLHFCDSLLYYTPFAPDAGRGAGSQGQ